MAELFAQRAITSQVSVLGGITYVDAKLVDTGAAATNDKRVVGVPQFKTELSIDYHPDFARGFALTGTLHRESTRAATNTTTALRRRTRRWTWARGIPPSCGHIS